MNINTRAIIQIRTLFIASAGLGHVPGRRDLSIRYPYHPQEKYIMWIKYKIKALFDDPIIILPD